MTEDEIRKRFEAWISAEPYALPVDRYGDDSCLPWPGQYITYKAELAWCAWLAAWQQAIGQQHVEGEE